MRNRGGLIIAVFLWLSPLQAETGFWPDSEDENMTRGVIFVSLGCDCFIAKALRHWRLRNAAFPFDWNFSLFLDKVIKLIDEDFRFFFTRDFGHQSCCGCKGNLYSVEFCHDNPFYDPADPETTEIMLKYERRIERFRSLRFYPGKVIFMRQAYDNFQWPNAEFGRRIGKIDKEEALALRDSLRRYFPGLDFLLVIINLDNAGVPPITDIENVIEYKIGSFHKFGSYRAIFEELMNFGVLRNPDLPRMIPFQAEINGKNDGTIRTIENNI
jgi:hypothetical protein